MIEIKDAAKADLTLIQQLAYIIWSVAYKEILSPDQLDYMLKKMHSINALSKLMNDGHRFIIPYEDDIAKGYCCYKIYEDKTRIEKIYVLPDQHKKGIGKLLIDYVTERSKPFVNTIELNVNRQNNAVNFYKKIGFEILREEDIAIGNGYFMNDYIMEKALL
jgi:ribosomal protein S18 acetylase RimI-like enzyme